MLESASMLRGFYLQATSVSVHYHYYQHSPALSKSPQPQLDTFNVYYKNHKIQSNIVFSPVTFFSFFFFLKLSSLKPCHQHLSYLPGGSANSIRGTCLTNALPLSVSVSFTALAICGVACLAPHFLLCDRYPHSGALRCPAGCPCRRWSLARLE